MLTFNMCMRNDFMFHTHTELDRRQSCCMGLKEGTPLGILFPQFLLCGSSLSFSLKSAFILKSYLIGVKLTFLYNV